MHSLKLWVVWLLPSIAAAQTLIYTQFTPPVIVPGSTINVTLQARVNGSPAKVTFESSLQAGVETNMTNQGSGVYSISLAVAPYLAAMQADDVYRPFMGRIRPYNGSTSTGAYSIFAEVADPQIPRVPVKADANDVQHTDFVVNILMPLAFPLAATPDVIPDQSVVTKRFYQFFPDNFDVINVVYVPSFYQNRFHYAVRNSVQGIGLPQINIGAQYGSAANLQGMSVFPLSSYFDGADTGVEHEFGHQFINHLNVAPVGAVRPHWPFSTMASGIMGFSIPPTLQGGNFACLIVPNGPSGIRLVPNPNQPVWGDLDLYLMGLLPPEQVPEQIVLDSSDQNFVFSHCDSNPYPGTFTRLHITDLTGNPSIGARVPSSANAPKRFRLATVVVTRDALLSSDAMAFYSYFARRMEAQISVPIHQGFVKAIGYPFAVSSHGLGTMSGRITPLPLLHRRDFHGDGRSGALLYDQPSGAAYAALSSGNGTYQYVPQGFTAGFNTLRTGDFNGDGRADVILYNSQTALAYIGLGNGNGTFAFGSLFWSAGYDTVEIGDLNADGLTDVALYNTTNGTLYTGISDGTGLFRYKYTLVSKGFTYLRLADFTGDGAADIFLYNKSSGSAFLGAGDGAGGFTFHPLFLSANYNLADIGDLNGDGKADLILYNATSGAAATGISDGSGGFTFNPMVFSTGFTSVRLADYTGDGKADVTVYNKNNAAAYFGTGNGGGGFAFQSLFWSPGYDSVEPQEANGDGKSDVILYNSATGTEYTGISNGNGTFGYTYQYWGLGRMLAK